MPHDLFVVIGPRASGKTTLAHALASLGCGFSVVDGREADAAEVVAARIENGPVIACGMFSPNQLAALKSVPSRRCFVVSMRLYRDALPLDLPTEYVWSLKVSDAA